METELLIIINLPFLSEMKKIENETISKESSLKNFIIWKNKTKKFSDEFDKRINSVFSFLHDKISEENIVRVTPIADLYLKPWRYKYQKDVFYGEVLGEGNGAFFTSYKVGKKRLLVRIKINII